MHHSDNTSKTVRLTPNPYPYQYDNIGRELDEYMRGPGFLNLVVSVFESAPRLYRDFIPRPDKNPFIDEADTSDEELLRDLEPPRNWSVEEREKYIETYIDAHRWRIDVCLVPYRPYGYRDQMPSVVLVSCLVADLSGGSVKVTVESYKPEGNPLVDTVWAVVQENWAGGKNANDILAEEPSKSAAKQRGPTIRTQERARIFKAIKDRWPALGYDGVAEKANKQELTDQYTGETVRNTYRAMNWEWDRGDRAR